MMNNKDVLVVEDDPAITETCRAYLARGGYHSRAVGTVMAAREELARKNYQVVLLDLALPDGSGFDVLDYLQGKMRTREVAVIIITADATMTTAIDAMRRGAYDYLVKPFGADRLLTTLRNAENTLSLQSMITTMREQINRERFGDFIGGSVPMQLVYKIIEAASASRATVFITGESGTGKEVAAHTIHTHSRRAGGPFIAVNCAAIPHELMESELFGHVRGAFTGATADRMGAVERALGGTLFLDEICEMPLDLQPKLLRFLQSNTYQPVGSDDVRSTNCRIIAATNRDPIAEIGKNNFREDLYYRLHVVPLHLPPLRSRRDDILPLAMNALRQFSAEEGKGFSQFTPEVQQLLLAYRWPGNVRELRNAIQQMVVLNHGTEITRNMLPANLLETQVDIGWMPAVMQTILESEEAESLVSRAANRDGMITPLWEVERQAIEKALDHFDGNVQSAAEALQSSASTIYRKRAEWAEGQEALAG